MKKLSASIIVFSIACVIFGFILAILFAQFNFIKGNDVKKIMILKNPLILESPLPSKIKYILPPGTTLYYDQSYGEGFSRFHIYINIEGMKIELDRPSDSTEIRPLTAYPPGKEEIIKLLSEYPLSREDLASILKSKSISRDDIREILQEYSK